MKMISTNSMVLTEHINIDELQEQAALKATGSCLETQNGEGRDFERGWFLHSFGRKGPFNVTRVERLVNLDFLGHSPMKAQKSLTSLVPNKKKGGERTKKLFSFVPKVLNWETKPSISRSLHSGQFVICFSAIRTIQKLIDSPLLEVDLRRPCAIQILDAHSRRTMIRNCIKSLMKSDANLLASRFLHTLVIIDPRMPRKSALSVKEEM
jgi:hypothetical protein